MQEAEDNGADTESSATICHPEGDPSKTFTDSTGCKVADKHARDDERGRWQMVAAKSLSPALYINKLVDTDLGATICHPKAVLTNSDNNTKGCKVADENRPVTVAEARHALTAALRSAGLADEHIPLAEVPEWIAPAPGIYAAELVAFDDRTGTVDVAYVGRWGRARQRFSGLSAKATNLLVASAELHGGHVRLQLEGNGKHVVWPLEYEILN